MLNIIPIFLLQAAEPLSDKLWLLLVGALVGSIIPTTLQLLFNRRKTNADSRKTDAETASILLDKLEKWIKLFEEAKDEAYNTEAELAKLKRDCSDCLKGKKDYLAFCKNVARVFDYLETNLPTAEFQIILTEMKNLRGDLLKLEDNLQPEP